MYIDFVAKRLENKVIYRYNINNNKYYEIISSFQIKIFITRVFLPNDNLC